MYEKLLEKINEYDHITIFRHARPDGDCVFSSLALYNFLKDNFINKKIKLAGKEEYDLISIIQNVSDKFIKDSLCIVLDVANLERVDDDRCKNGSYIIKIDHHPPVSNYGKMNIVHPEASSTCQILAEILLSKTFSKFNVSNKVCEYLYCGMITDTINFRTTNTSSKTMLVASKLIKKANLNVSDLVGFVMNQSLDTFKKVTEIRNYLVINKNFGYILLKKKDLDKIGIDPIQAKNNIDEIGSINELNIWAFAVENNGKFDISIRSKKGYIVNNIAAKYRGGGHPNAAATKQLSSTELNVLLDELTKLS